MPAYRIGFGSDFNLANQFVGIGTTTADVRLEVINVLKGDFNITGVATLTSYGGFAAQKQLGDDDVITGEVNSISEDIVVSVGKTFTVSVGATVYPGTLESVSIGTHFSFPNGGIAARPEEPIEGTVRFNDDLNTLEFYNGVEWRQFTITGASGRGVFGGGYSGGGGINTIEYINISSLGNGQDFGVLTTAGKYGIGGCADSIRGLFAGGGAPGGIYYNVIEYITINSAGNAIDFGDLTLARQAVASLSSSTRGIWGGGYNPAAPSPTTNRNIIDYVQIQTLGNALDFGDTTFAGGYRVGFASPTRGIFAGGTISPAVVNTIEFITISSTGNAVDFGDLTVSRYVGSACASSTRGVLAGGYTNVASLNTIDYITIATTGNATAFGDLTKSRIFGQAASSNIRGILTGNDNTMDYITIATTGNAQSFGNMTRSAGYRGGLSDSHGGLGGF